MAKNLDCWLFDVSRIVSTRCHASGFACSCLSTLSAAVLCGAVKQLLQSLGAPWACGLAAWSMSEAERGGLPLLQVRGARR